MLTKVRLKLAYTRLERELKTFDEDTPIETLLDFAYSELGSLITPWQDRQELAALSAELKKSKPKTVLEIGTSNGGTLFMLCRLAHPKARVMSIDLPGGPFGGGYPEWKTELYENFKLPQQSLLLLRDDSQKDDSYEHTCKFFNGRGIDFILIDADHTYEGVKRDYEKYAPLLSKGGMMAFHDIVEHPGSRCQVHTFWQEVKQGRKYKEFVRDWKQRQFGIGLLYN